MIISLRYLIPWTVFLLLFALEGLAPFYGGRRGRFRHALPNLGLSLINGFLQVFIFAALLVSVMLWTEANHLGLLNSVSWHPVLELVLALLLFDAWMYLWHRLNHEWPFLWRFHRVHHTDTEMDSTTALRFHFGEMILSSCLRAMILPIFGMNFIQFFIYELCMQPVIFFHHSNVRLPKTWDRVMRFLIVTPNMHRVHHSDRRIETDSNYATIFSFWDRLAGSYQVREPEKMRFGLKAFHEPKWHRLKGLLMTPFMKVPREEIGN